MRIPITLRCDECGAEISEECFHLIAGGIIMRFCSQSHRSKFARARCQIIKQERADAQQSV